MANLTIGVGLWLIVLGVAGYVMTGMASMTALIPAAFGIVLALLGGDGRVEGRRRTAMHVAMGLAVAGFLGSMGGLAPAVQWLSGGEVTRPAAAVSRSLMAMTLIAYLAMGIRSFVAARANRGA
jgi:hypothetical protein